MCKRNRLFVERLAVLIGVGAFTAPATAASTSLCISLEEGCEIPGTVVSLTVRVGESSAGVVGAQFTIDYDPSMLKFLDITPGRKCDPESPFELAIFSSVNEAAGQVFFSVGVDALAVAQGEDFGDGPFTLACVRMLPRTVGMADVCLLEGEHPQVTRLADEHGFNVSIANATDCPSPASSPVLTCASLMIDEQCSCKSVGGDCSSLDSACRRGACDLTSGFCRIEHINEGGPCDDENDCTSDEVCQQGQCEGFDCTNPSLCLVHANCGVPGDRMDVVALLGEGEPVISIGQLAIQYDPAGLDLMSISPGFFCDPQSPFSVETSRKIDEISGEISYIVAVPPGGGSGAEGPRAMACLSFHVLDRTRTQVGTFSGVNPFVTRLVDRTGRRVDVFNAQDCPTTEPFPITANVDFQFCPIPTTSEWGIVVIALLLCVLGKIYFGGLWQPRSSPMKSGARPGP